METPTTTKENKAEEVPVDALASVDLKKEFDAPRVIDQIGDRYFVYFIVKIE